MNSDIFTNLILEETKGVEDLPTLSVRFNLLFIKWCDGNKYKTDDDILFDLRLANQFITDKLDQKGGERGLIQYYEEDKIGGKVRSITNLSIDDDRELLSAISYCIEKKMEPLMVKQATKSYEENRKINETVNSRKPFLSTFKWESKNTTVEELFSHLSEQGLIKSSLEDFKFIFSDLGLNLLKRKVFWLDKHRGDVNKVSLIILLLHLKASNFISYNDKDFNKIIESCFCDFSGKEIKNVDKTKSYASNQSVKKFKKLTIIVDRMKKRPIL